MNFYSNFLLFVIVLITIYLLYRLFVQRYKIFELNTTNKNAFIENFDMNKNYKDSIVTNLALYNKSNLTINSFIFKSMDYADESAFELRNFCIKSSYCSVFNGLDCTIDMLYYVLSRGCRFIDLELYYDYDKKPESVLVGYSNDYLIPSTSNSLDLSDVFDEINKNAFTAMSPNNNDPLFIQLRLKHIPTNLTDPEQIKSRLQYIYDLIAGSAKAKLSLLYGNAPINAKTSIQTLQRQIVLIMDSSYNNRDYSSISPNLKKIINFDCPSSDIKKRNSSDLVEEKLKISSDGITTDSGYLRQIVPTVTENEFEYHLKDNLDGLAMLTKYSANMCPMQFWVNGPQLQAYENIFNTGRNGVLPIAHTLSYSQQQSINPTIIYP